MPGERRAAVLRVTAVCAAIAATQPLPGLLYYVAWSSQKAAVEPLLGFWTTPDWFAALPVLVFALLWAHRRTSDNAMVDAARFVASYLAYAFVAGTVTAARYLLAGEGAMGAVLSAGLSTWGWSASSGAILVGALWPMVLLRHAARRGYHDAASAGDRDAEAESALADDWSASASSSPTRAGRRA